ncbi:pyridoxamine 5'-phosphate oxidase family protein [Accumulibacter sp.]|uniref:2Fe-2S iron-sulfur cluster-binding protein n=1 Tax=Accumulibacter sp. TaxID=2053492 RepID=UPI0025F58051|nr:pyridoxamine 5'-phosphate oxidase family protein [Accumulibacter sp.]MCM8614123.1 pyridoxamine 5'-phosphate oxidase family protein [Accumulibacter sp.]MCM8637853.1 pyridoxamine 5'-phosphate oxidase family protein [Accumulibacter sp.]MCM8641260.1 pyridoxamine 5'-phosphate oxidase family protein [Accumulibacter sp.]
MSAATTSPWHRGERELQQSVGVAERMEVFGRQVIRDFMPEQHRTFYRQLPFLVIAAVDQAGDPWATLVEARAGLAQSPDARHLQINALPGQGDPAGDALRPGDGIGVLGIELQTRRRNRVNGRVVACDDRQLTLQVEHAFGNCPQYIQARNFSFAGDPAEPFSGRSELLSTLDAEASAMIRAADTFFVASYVDPDGDAGRRQVDASHRGGKPGFVRVDADVLTIPDFAGNLHFNTLGNLQVNPRAGLLFIDFATGDLLQLAGRTELVLAGDEVGSFRGAERLWRLHVDKAVRRRRVLKLRWRLEEISPNCLMTGSWEEALARQQAEALRNQWRRFRIAGIINESATIKSFHLEAADGAGLPLFRAGQHLPIRLAVAPGAAPLIRTYTLSVAPSDGYYRISVKRAGRVSRFLHEHVAVGDEIEARAPLGDFVVAAHERRPLVLLSAGVGITPMLAMLREVVYEGVRTRRVRRTFFVHASRTLAERPFDGELQELVERADGAVDAVRILSQPEPAAVLGSDHDVHGRIDLPLLKAILPFDDFDFYLCGPAALAQDLYDGLRAMQIADERIHVEQFGPSSLRRRVTEAVTENPRPTLPAAETSVAVVFARSAKEARWQPGGGSLLELAEARGLTPEFSCRGGSCGTCKTRILAGQVSYTSLPAVALGTDEILTCCSVPAAGAGNAAGLVLDL